MILHTFQQLTLIVEYEFKMTSNYRFTPTGGRKEKEKKKNVERDGMYRLLENFHPSLQKFEAH